MKTQKYLNEYGQVIIAYFFEGNVQWEIEGKKEKRVEPKEKFNIRTKKWKIITYN